MSFRSPAAAPPIVSLHLVARISIRRKRSSSAPTVLTAAAARLLDPVKSFRSALSPKDDDWQALAWQYYEHVGELRYYANWRAASVSRCRIVASELDPDTGRPTGDTDNAEVAAIIRDIAGGIMGQAQLLKRLTLFLTLPGEGYVAMILRDPELEETEDGQRVDVQLGALMEEWLALNRDEIKSSGGDLVITLCDGVRHKFDAESDLIFRVWNPHPRDSRDADSPTRSARDILDEIMRTTSTIDNAAKSRLVGNGILFVPQEMSLPKQQQPPTATPPGGPAPTPAAVWEQASSQDLQDLLYEVATTAYKDQNSMAAFLPVVAAVPGEWTDKVKHIRFDADVSKTALETREAAIGRLARALDVSPERLLGMGDHSNHWSAWAISEDDVKVHLVPVLDVICDALTTAILRPALEERGLDPDAFVVWYDTTGLTQDPDRKTETLQVFDRGGIRADVMRDHLGFDETDGYDFTTVAGIQQFARDKVAQDITQLPLLAPLLGVPSIESSTPAAPAIESAPADDEPAVDAEPVADESPEDAPPEPDALPASLYVVAHLCVSRALELANKRRRSRHTADAFAHTRIDHVHLHLPPLTDPVDPLIEGWSTGVDDAGLAAIGVDPYRFARLVECTAERALQTSSLPEIVPAELRAVLV